MMLPTSNSSWDAMDPTRLIQLTRWRKMSTGFGYLLRHYWMPATRLTWKRVTQQHLREDGETLTSEDSWKRTLLKCDADQCVWRDDFLETDRQNKHLVRFSLPHAAREIHYYNRSEQTYRVRPVPGLLRWPEEEQAARNQAFLQQPLLNPLLPIPVGFQWHVRNEGDYMDFTLSSAASCEGEMTLLLIRRKGVFHLNKFFIDQTAYDHRFKIVRHGLTAYALERAMILEDRAYDRLQSVSAPSEIDGMETWNTVTLLKSKLLEGETSLTIRDSVIDSLYDSSKE